MSTFSLTEALGWTLLHSLWQAALVALAFSLVRHVVRQPTATYRWAAGALVLVVSWSLYTFIDLYKPEPTSAATVPTQAPLVSAATSSLPVSESPRAAPLSVPSWSESVATWINPYLRFVVIGWLLGIMVLSTRLVGGLWYLSRLKRLHTFPLPAWEATVATLATRLGLRRTVTLVASALAKAPLVVGHLKPVVVFPVALVSSLPPEHIEAILAHELAHVHRQDYWINILQSVVDSIFFYHPAVGWISSIMREEREKCCDDLAVSLCGNTLGYAKALSEVEMLQHAPPAMALAFARRRGGVFARIERLVHPTTSSPGPTFKGLSIVLILLLATYLAVGDTLSRQAGQPAAWVKNDLYPVRQNSPIPIASDTVKPVKEADQNDGWQGSDKARTFTTLPRPDTSPDENDEQPSRSAASRPYHFSFHIGDSTDFAFGATFGNDTFPTFSWNDSLWLESVGEVGEHLEALSKEMKDYLTDSVVTDALQERLEAVQRELGQLQAELGSTLQRSFNEERMEAWQDRLQEEKEQMQRELERIQRTMERSQQRLEESQRRAQERQQEAQRRQQRVHEQQRAQERQREARERSRTHRDFGSTVEGLERELLADGLIRKGKEYRFELKPKGLYINRKKQKDDLLDKYRDLLHVSESTNFSITRTAE